MQNHLSKSKLFLILFLLVGTVAIVLFASSATSPEKKTYESNANSEILHEEGQLVENFPDFPEYPGAELKESSQRQQAINSNQDLRAVWEVSAPVKDVMKWYIEELPKNGWSVEPPNDPNAEGEQVAQLSKDDLEGYIGIEDEGNNITEIVVDFRKVRE